MNTTLKIALGLAMAVSFSLGISGCSNSAGEPETPQEHKHTFEAQWSTDENYHWHVVTCEHEEVLEKRPHVFDEKNKVVVDSTADEPGSETVTCIICGYKFVTMIPLKPHDHELGEFHLAAEGTCVKKGNTYYYDCAKKGCTAKIDYEGNELESVETVYGPHKVDIFNPAAYHPEIPGTCVQKAVCYYYDCANEGCTAKLDYSGKEITSLYGDFGPHSKGTYHPKVEETCTAPGNIQYYDCMYCPVKLEHVRYEVIESVEIPADPSKHSWDGDYVSNGDATRTSDGTKTRKCTLCKLEDTVTDVGSRIKYERLNENFVKVYGITITGEEQWTPESNVFVPGRKINIPDLIVSDHQVTRREYYSVMGKYPKEDDRCRDKDGNQLTGEAADNCAANYLSWYDAVEYCNILSEREGLTPCYTIDKENPEPMLSQNEKAEFYNRDDKRRWTVTCNFKANGYRLPSLAEGEWLARGGEDYPYPGSNSFYDVSWLFDRHEPGGQRASTVIVKMLKPNGFDLYDMVGNVGELCWDWWSPAGTITEDTPPYGAESHIYGYRTMRGGSVAAPMDNKSLVSSYNGAHQETVSYDLSHVGFRVVRNAE